MPHSARARWAAIAALSLTALAGAACTPQEIAAAVAAQEASATVESQVLSRINAERARAGVGPLQLSAGASSVADGWSGHMAGTGTLAHNPDLGGALSRAGVAWSRIAENVGYSTRGADDVVSQFMGSSFHRGNILSTRYRDVGIGVVDAGGRSWVTLDFVG